jgi:hypothetical protein
MKIRPGETAIVSFIRGTPSQLLPRVENLTRVTESVDGRPAAAASADSVVSVFHNRGKSQQTTTHSGAGKIEALPKRSPT